MGPSTLVRTWNGYYVNGYNFQTQGSSKHKSTMNYGVCVSNDGGSDFFGILDDVIELKFTGALRQYNTILFKCNWMDNVRGMNIDQYKLVEVNHTKKYPKFDPFVLSYQVSMSNPKERGGRDGLGGSQGRGKLIRRELFESPGAPESPNLGSETQRDDSHARDIGDHVPETPSSQREEAEGSNRASKRVLSPTGLWFDDNKVSGSITDIFQGHFREPWFNYREVDDATKTHWWNSFTGLYEWAPELDGQVKSIPYESWNSFERFAVLGAQQS
ncbi:uncharacterized protein LOC125492550 [Beta vulgaris subsp. vulgaris]|uniref:uncharacterized protein LOC125492550 n=1 Tax=Beta vulgaris subsp. vulgaris TaxID=3555 RepID=UPI0025482728|nr:uncharacterized protein LOC125492550 [Beta vulgaris subsp. vulgaris]